MRMARSVARFTDRVNSDDLVLIVKMGGITRAEPYFLAHRRSIFDH